MFRILLHFQLRSYDWQPLKVRLSLKGTDLSMLSAQITGFISEWKGPKSCVMIYHSVDFQANLSPTQPVNCIGEDVFCAHFLDKKQLLGWHQQLILHKLSNGCQTRSLELCLVSILELKEPIRSHSVLGNVLVNEVRRPAVPNNLRVEISSSGAKL